MKVDNEHYTELLIIVNLFLDSIEGDPLARQFFDPRLIDRAKRAVNEEEN